MIKIDDECIRHKWMIDNAFPLNDENNRKELMSYICDGESID